MAKRPGPCTCECCASREQLLDWAQMYAELNSQVNAAGGQAAFARRHGLVLQTLSNAINGHRKYSRAILEKIGLEKVTRYRRVVKKDAT